WLNLVMTLPLPLMAAVVTVFMLRPFRLRHLIWGLLIPVIPLTALFDGIVSNLRTYTVQELEELTRSIDLPGFQWEVGTAAMPRTRLKATYLFGWRTTR
ncbi:MAG: class I SAM-dependent methyltransferase, partial [bacterium]|nr:class I SAM-dependent methyltransferase [bacterium]